MKQLRLILLLIPIVASADPGQATNYLINDPVSMMDIGIFKANRRMMVLFEDIKSVYRKLDKINLINVTGLSQYKHDDDLIVLNATLGTLETSAEVLESECRDILISMRAVTKNNLDVWFSHEGFQRASAPDNLLNQIGERVELRCVGISSPSTTKPPTLFVQVRTKLNDETVFVTKEEFE